jgi:SAM-dependent methyltransferase
MMRPRSDYERVAKSAQDPRSLNQITEHYLLERNLADQLRQTAKESRGDTYREVYATLFSRLPDHPQHNGNFQDNAYVSRQADLLRKLAPAGCSFVEIGAGDARLAMEMASHCRSVIAVDVTDTLFRRDRAPANVSFVLTSGTNIDIPSESVDFVYSNQLMEHLHPEDAEDQLREIVRILKPGGRYFCITPNVTSGPHDVSKYFDQAATGFHLKEYSFASLASAMRTAGFRDATALLVRQGDYRVLPLSIGRGLELMFRAVQTVTGISLRSIPKFRNVLGINMIAVK